MTIQQSRVVMGNGMAPALSIWMDGSGCIWLTQNDQDTTYEAWECGFGEVITDSRMNHEIHAIADVWIDAADSVAWK